MHTVKREPSVKKLWIDALRSGKYKQGVNSLNRNNNFCCLGVLCDIHRIKVTKKGPKLWKNHKNLPDSTYFNKKDIPPQSVSLWAFDTICQTNPTILISELPEDIKSIIKEAQPNCVIGSHREVISLAELNDTFRLTFYQIADVIEKCL